MRRTYIFALALLGLALIPISNFSQNNQTGGQMEGSHAIEGGGEEFAVIHHKTWHHKTWQKT